MKRITYLSLSVIGLLSIVGNAQCKEGLTPIHSGENLAWKWEVDHKDDQPAHKGQPVHKGVEREIKEATEWRTRRQLGIPNQKKLFVITCMDERIPIHEALGIDLDDAHIMRNAGAEITDDVIRGAFLTTNFFGTKELIVVGHTECGMMSAKGSDVVNAAKKRLTKKGLDLNKINLDPRVPQLKLLNPNENIEKWIGMFDNVHKEVAKSVGYLKNHPLIPKDVIVKGYVWDVNSMTLEHVGKPRGGKVYSTKQMGTK